MAYTTIDKPTDYFETVIWTGNGSGRDITVSHGTNWIWGKRRNGTNAHWLMDTVRGVDKRLISNSTAVEDDPSTAILTAFNSNGFSLGTNSECNLNGATYVGWSWKAGTSFTNDASSTGIGSIDSTGSVSDASGFSIVSYTGTGSNGTIKHGLSTTPKMIIQKNRDETQPWWTYVESIGAGGQLRLSGTDAEGSDGGVLWNSTAPTSSVFSVGDNTGTNGSADKCIAYCFAEKQGYSKFGSYTGNGNADGTFVYTGFKPAFVMRKRTDATANWTIIDNKRDTFNLADAKLKPNLNEAENDDSSNGVDFLSNGFKTRTTDTEFNADGGTYIYMAFAENPFVTSTGVPTTAR